MALPLKRKIRTGYIIAFLLLLFSYLLIFYIAVELKRETKWVFHSYDIINNLHSLKSEITEAETGVRGYVITKDIRYLQPYTSSHNRVVPLFRDLRQLTSNNEAYKNKLDSLERLINRRMTSLSEGLVAFQQNGFNITPEMTENRDANRSIMDSVRLIVDQLMDAEKSLWQYRNTNLQDFFTTTKMITSISLVIAILTAFYSIITFNRENRAKERADKAAKIYRRELEETVEGLKNANRELEELKHIEKFASTGRIARTIAHEVRNPITNISLAAEQLKEMNSEYEDAIVLIDMVSRNATRINQLVSDLLNSTRFTQLNYDSFNINEIIDETLQLAYDRIELNGIKVIKEYGTGVCDVYVDKERIKLAFLNIMVNAIEAMKNDSGVLTIKTTQSKNDCIVEISDNGSGMEEETLRNLFEPYFTTKQKGNGLGMTNTQNIILNHGGKITVNSRLGEGTTFIITLDLNQAKPEV